MTKHTRHFWPFMRHNKLKGKIKLEVSSKSIGARINVN